MDISTYGKKAIYGLKQSGALANKMLSKILNKEGYYQAKHTKGLWLHRTKNTSFIIVVDDCGVKYVQKQDIEELINILEKTYPCKCNWKVDRCIVLNLDWNYQNTH